MHRSEPNMTGPRPPGVWARGFLVVTALSLTSCPHQLALGKATSTTALRGLRILKKRALRLLFASTRSGSGRVEVSARNFFEPPSTELDGADDEARLSQPQILSPRYRANAANRLQDPDPVEAPATASTGVAPGIATSATNLVQPTVAAAPIAATEHVAAATPIAATEHVAAATPIAAADRVVVAATPIAAADRVVAATPASPGAAAPAETASPTLAGAAAPAEIATAALPRDLAAAAEERQSVPPSDGLVHLPIHDPPPTDDPLIYSIGRETWIYAEPNYDSKRLGYLRFGSEVRRTSEAVGRKGCAGGWYGVQPAGYVCVNARTATADPKHPLLTARLEPPNRAAALPYAYALARRGLPRFFSYLPAGGERPESSFSKRLLSGLGNPRTPSVPDWLRSSREIFGYPRPKDAASIGNGLIGGGIALLGFFSEAKTLYGMTPDLELVSTDALEAAKPSTFAGKALGDQESLPVAMVMGSGGWLYDGDPRQGNLRPLRPLLRREAVTVESDRTTVQGQVWVQTKDGHWLRASGLRLVEARSDWPEWAKPGQAWVDVSINQQTLVAYEGNKALYVTLVSTGVDGLLDPATTKSTKTGTFRIQSKHLTATMNGEDPDGAYEMREVPWVQYFSEGYALHGAYWHDGFGQPRSHGCINLSPKDARWLFHFTNPGLPKNWHGAIPSEKSAVVYVHP